MLTADQIKSILSLAPHPAEGGYFVETYRATEAIPASALPDRYSGARSFSTAIYYLLTPETFSEMHRVTSDEVFHFYLGDPVEMLQLGPDGSGHILTLGSDIVSGMRPQVVVPAGIWQGARLQPGGSFALLGTTVAPGFEYADYTSGEREALLEAYPEFADQIVALTHP
ncbi:MAG: cupin domain-containing protein [Anaerolineae bacterium]|jgi:predicted cupin superfamily sugar epimerase